MTNFEGNKEEEEEIWHSIIYNSSMPLRGMKKTHNTSGKTVDLPNAVTKKKTASYS